jgi:hypothetical protein
MTAELFRHSGGNGEVFFGLIITCSDCGVELDKYYDNNMAMHLCDYHRDEIESMVCNKCKEK